MDSNTGQFYYYNTSTGKTQWERPTEMGPAPHATGWFGRGAAGGAGRSKYDKLDEEWKKRKARKQLKNYDRACCV